MTRSMSRSAKSAPIPTSSIAAGRSFRGLKMAMEGSASVTAPRPRSARWPTSKIMIMPISAIRSGAGSPACGKVRSGTELKNIQTFYCQLRILVLECRTGAPVQRAPVEAIRIDGKDLRCYVANPEEVQLALDRRLEGGLPGLVWLRTCPVPGAFGQPCAHRPERPSRCRFPVPALRPPPARAACRFGCVVTAVWTCRSTRPGSIRVAGESCGSNPTPRGRAGRSWC